MRPVLLIRNDRYESFGVAPGALASEGMDLWTADATSPDTDLPPLERVAGVIAFGGTVNIPSASDHPHLGRVRDYTRAALDHGVPYLGICLGSQLLAWASGTPVVRGDVREVGFEPVRPTPEAKGDRLLSFLDDEEVVLQWHEDTHALPDGATLLVTGDRVPVQGYRIGPHAWGIQFHLEVDAHELEWWLGIADAEIDLEEVWGKSADRIRGEARAHMARQDARGREIFRRFAEVAREAAAAPQGAGR
jgi:GMP synthase (glutamine-hydrolysing)